MSIFSDEFDSEDHLKKSTYIRDLFLESVV